MDGNEKKKVLHKLNELEEQVDKLSHSTGKSSYTAGSGITIENNVISASASGGQGLTQEQATKLEQAYNYYLTHVVEPDPSYNPQSFSDYPAGTILQTYAKFSQRCNLTFTTTLSSPKMVFSAIDNSTGTLNIKLIFTCSNNFNGTIDIYQNNTSIYHELYSFDDSSHSYVFERSISGLTLSDGNVFFVKIVSNTSTSFILSKYESELIAPNAEVINQISPFDVEYFAGKYYISDCSSGTAKLAEIDVNDMFNINSLSWTDTGIDCLQYKTSFNMALYGNEWTPDERYDYYLTPDGNYTFKKISDGTTATYAQSLKLDWCQATASQLKYAEHQKYSGGLNILTYNLSTFGYNSRVGEQIYNLCSAKYLVDITTSNTRAYAVVSKNNGHLFPYLIHGSSSVTLDLGFGKNQHCYFDNPTNQVAPMICYYNHFGKIIKKEFNYTASTRAYAITNTEEIGSYDEYFEGVNNDYFVVKNGALEYHKKPTPNE